MECGDPGVSNFLIIDDDAAVAGTLGKRLGQAGHSATSLNSAMEVDGGSLLEDGLLAEPGALGVTVRCRPLWLEETPACPQSPTGE